MKPTSEPTGESHPTVRTRVAAPFYLHPAEAPEAWHQLLTDQLPLAFAVVNVSSGPGTQPDPYYSPLLNGTPRPNHTRLVGYIDAAYGNSSVESLVQQCQHWQQWYQVDAVFIDCLPSVPRLGAWDCGHVTSALRRNGASWIVGNPGVQVQNGVGEHLDVTCTLECAAADYLNRAVPPGPGAGAQWHMVHSLDTQHHLTAVDIAAHAQACMVDYVWISPDPEPHPWGNIDFVRP